MSDTRKKFAWLTAGIILSSLLMLPYLILGEDSIIPYHDQLDGELLGYLLGAKYLFTGANTYPELMNGLPVTGAVPPAVLFVLLYRIFPAFTAFLISQWILYVVGFIGMFLMLEHLTGRRFIAFVIGMIFTLFSFYPVYGLCIPGQPLLLWAVLRMGETVPSGQSSGGIFFRIRFVPLLPYLLLIVLYGLCSSLVLVGFAVLAVLLVGAAVSAVRARRSHIRAPFAPWLALLTLGITYLLSNLSLIGQILFPDSAYISHKTEVVYSAQDYLSAFLEVFTQGISYAQSRQAAILPLAGICVLVLLVRRIQGARNGSPADAAVSDTNGRAVSGHRFLTVLLFILVICVLYALYLGDFVTDLRNSSEGVLKSFNLMRIAWVLPTAWCLLAGFAAAYLTDPERRNRLRSIAVRALVWVSFAVWGFIALYQSPLKANLMKLVRGDDYYAMTWNGFFAEDIFDEIKEAIGEPQDSYRVVSLGIYPAAAAYNGFYCLDAYSNNYPVSYKHEFREIMAAELEKSDYVRAYYDEWGNRCYLMSAQYSNYFTFEKKWGATFDGLELDPDKLREMGCRYLFSAGYITNAEDMGLSLLRDEPFETEGSWYRIYVYVIPEQS